MDPQVRRACSGDWSCLWMCLWLCLLLCAQAAPAYAADPFAVLGVSRDDSDSAIRKQYHKLCLRYHPDKQVHKSLREKKLLEEKFKTIQSAYSQIATADSRRRLEAQHGPFQSYSAPANPNSYTAEDLFREFHQDHQTFARAFSHNHRFGRHALFTDATSPFLGKFIHQESIQVPLATLYRGNTTLQHSVRLGLGRRLVAGVRGGAIYSLVYTSLLYALPSLRLVGRTMTLLVWVGLLVAMLPPTPPEITLRVPIRTGYKPGTRLTFCHNETVMMDIVLVIKAAKERNYKLVGNDLHTSVTITKEQATSGCLVRIPRLGSNASHDALNVRINAGTRDRDTLVIPGEGWPIRRRSMLDSVGNLVVHVKVHGRGAVPHTSSRA